MRAPTYLPENLAPKSEGCNLCAFKVGDGAAVSADLFGSVVGEGAITTVQIGNVTAQYVEGMVHGTDCCGWVWDGDPYAKRLRWQANGVAYEFFYTGMEITKEDMIAIAESMK